MSLLLLNNHISFPTALLILARCHTHLGTISQISNTTSSAASTTDPSLDQALVDQVFADVESDYDMLTLEQFVSLCEVRT